MVRAKERVRARGGKRLWCIVATSKNRVVVLDEPAPLPDGAEVQVEIVVAVDVPPPRPPRTLYDQLKPVIGMAKGLPPDLAENHDHYLHGQPKK